MFRFDLFINLNAKSRKINVINLVAGGEKVPQVLGNWNFRLG